MEALFSDYEDVRKSRLFDAEYYLATYPDVVARNVDPLVHYLEEGAPEGRNTHPDFDAGFYLEQCRRRGEEPANPLLHYIRIGAARGFKTRRGKEDDGLSADRPAGATDRAGKLPILVAIESLGIVGAARGASRLSAAAGVGGRPRSLRNHRVDRLARLRIVSTAIPPDARHPYPDVPGPRIAALFGIRPAQPEGGAI